MQAKLTITAILFVAFLLGSILIVTNSSSDTPQNAGGTTAAVAEAVIEDGVQYVDITALGGYTPRTTKAQAGIPTVIRMKTENTFDCSLALVIRDLNYQEFLPQNGVTEIEIPAEKARGTLRGMCSMAMYHFEIEFT